jgi:hypothetical protein
MSDTHAAGTAPRPRFFRSKKGEYFSNAISLSDLFPIIDLRVLKSITFSMPVL